MRNKSSARVLVFLLLATLAITTSAVATVCVPLKATSTYLTKLQNSAYYATYNSGSYYYKWSVPAPFPGAKQVRSGVFTNCTRVVQTLTNTDSQCVQFARQVSNVPGQLTSAWRRSVQIVANGKIRTDLTAGVLVATMDAPGGLYPQTYDQHPHVAVFLRRIDNNTIEVADQNFIAPYIVGKHQHIRIGGSQASDATRYWTIYVNQ